MPTFDKDNQHRIRVLFQGLQVLEGWFSGSEELPIHQDTMTGTIWHTFDTL